MNLEDVLSDGGLQQDEWSLTKPRFGEQEQLEVVGWSGKLSSNNSKFYILTCNKCAQDPVLFGEGYFKSIRGGLTKGRIPCGCSEAPRRTKEQYTVLCSRKAKELGHTFLGFSGEWKSQTTKIKMLCEKHGEWDTTTVAGLLNTSNGCPLCKLDLISRIKTKPDDIMIASFFASGAFHPDTKFWRSDSLSKAGCKECWFVHCPKCNTEIEVLRGRLQKGTFLCPCSPKRQQEAYINLVSDGEQIFALKFGISVDSKARQWQQNHYSVYDIKPHEVYKFPDTISCKKAERDCKQELECGVVLKRDMPDGYTETTWAYNLEKIIEIYERNGGIRKENP